MVRMSTLCLCLVLCACATPGDGPVIDPWCLKNVPHTFTEAQWNSMTNAQLDRETAHNEYGEKTCGWKPPKK